MQSDIIRYKAISPDRTIDYCRGYNEAAGVANAIIRRKNREIEILMNVITEKEKEENDRCET